MKKLIFIPRGTKHALFRAGIIRCAAWELAVLIPRPLGQGFMEGFIIACLIFSSVNAFAQEPRDPKYKLNPTPDKTSASGVYIPKDLGDCLDELKKMLSPELIKEMKAGKEDAMIKYHRGLGMWVRNNWGLWSGSRLAKDFNSLGLRHPDDMSSVILVSFWRYLNNKPVKLNEQVKYYQDYWEKIKKEKK
jgi:hypothetical protein